MKRHQLAYAILIGLMSIGGQSTVHAGHDENLQSYTIDNIIVEAERTINQFGDTMTEHNLIAQTFQGGRDAVAFLAGLTDQKGHGHILDRKSVV